MVADLSVTHATFLSTAGNVLTLLFFLIIFFSKYFFFVNLFFVTKRTLGEFVFFINILHNFGFWILTIGQEMKWSLMEQNLVGIYFGRFF